MQNVGGEQLSTYFAQWGLMTITNNLQNFQHGACWSSNQQNLQDANHHQKLWDIYIESK